MQPTQRTGWVGWVYFAGIILAVSGLFQAIQGLTAIFHDEVFLVGKNGNVIELDYTAWGWIHLIVGIAVLLAGLSLFRGSIYGRVVGVIFAVLSAVVNLAFIAAYPAWSILIIALDVLVIYALVVHGPEAREV